MSELCRSFSGVHEVVERSHTSYGGQVLRLRGACNGLSASQCSCCPLHVFPCPVSQGDLEELRLRE
jgi:hypothetical protein